MERTRCAQPDHDLPHGKMVCGHPLPCPHHTLVFQSVDDAIDTLDRIGRAKRTARRARARRKPEGTE